MKIIAECYCTLCLSISYSSNGAWREEPWKAVLFAPCLTSDGDNESAIPAVVNEKLDFTRTAVQERLWKACADPRNAKIAPLLRQAIIDPEGPFWKEHYHGED